MITIPVSGGSGSVSLNFGHIKCEGVSLISPDNTPMYSFWILNEAGAFIVGANAIDVQRTKISEQFALDGICTLTVEDAADDGEYKVQIFQR